MILSILDRYVSLSIDKIRVERLLKKAYLTNRRVARDLEKELVTLNASINFLYEKILNKITFSTEEELKDLSKCLERKALSVKLKISETDTVLKISRDNKDAAKESKDEIAVKTYETIIEDTVGKRKEQQEELNCYDYALNLCYKMRFASNVTK